MFNMSTIKVSGTNAAGNSVSATIMRNEDVEVTPSQVVALAEAFQPLVTYKITSATFTQTTETTLSLTAVPGTDEWVTDDSLKLKVTSNGVNTTYTINNPVTPPVDSAVAVYAATLQTVSGQAPISAYMTSTSDTVIWRADE